MASPRLHMSKSASSSRNASPVPSNGGNAQAGPSQPIDAYRPISSHVKKPLLPLLPTQSTPPNLPTLLSLDPSTYSSRLSGKTLLLNSDDPSLSSTTASPLVKGRKRNRGNPVELAKARAEVEENQQRLKGLGLDGLKKVKKRLGGVMKRGDKVDYNSLIPLYHLHTLYLLTLLAFPPLPSNTSSLSSISTNTNSDTILSKISKADFTGIFLTIVSSRNTSLIGIGGIVIEETAGTFRIVTTENEIKVIPKDGTLFRLSFPAYSPTTTSNNHKEGEETMIDMSSHLLVSPRMEIDLLGSSFVYKSSDRAGRKFRPAQGGGGGSGWGQEWIKEGEWSTTLDKLDDELRSTHSNVEAQKRTKRKSHPQQQQQDGKFGSGGTGRRKRGKSRRKDPPAGGGLEVF
nr:uncharacterized protein CI109_000938 [Kwoniella shandongensis]KAA5530758.1 hypothetical protein CI109_000938 [Kwoniella shandongensis]